MSHHKPFLFHPQFFKLFGRNRPAFSLKREVLAGVTVGFIALPLALALGIASIPAGVSTPLPAPALGIITAIIAGFIISTFGGSKIQIGGPTAAFIPIILLIVTKHGYSGLVLATLMAGVILVIMGIARMGSLIKFIPWPVTSGFTTGIAVAIMLSQIPDLLGLVSDSPVPLEFSERIRWIVHHIAQTNLHSFALALFCIVGLLLWRKLNLRLIPASIAIMIASTLLVAFAGWSSSGEVATIGSKFGANAIPSSFQLFHFPDWNLALLQSLLGPATAIALLGAIESLLSAVVADGISNDRHDSNTELIAQGIANIVCPFFGGLPATGAIARTSANHMSGGRTPVAGMVHAITLLVIALVAAKWVVYIPMAAMSAILIVVALQMGEWNELRRVNKMPRSDAAVLLTTFSLTVVFDLVVAVQIGMVLAAILFIKRVSETTEVSRVTSEDMLERPEHVAHGKDIPPDVLVYRVFGPFLFGAAEKMEDALDRIEKWPRILILRLHLVSAMDATGMNALQSMVERIKNRGGTVIISGIHQQPLLMLRKAGFINVIGRENFCETFDDSLRRARVLLDLPL